MDSLQINAPLHEQVRWDLLSRVRRGDFPPDGPIPNEAQLCDEYGVSRITIRRAIGDLCADNILYRRHGVGTFVTDAVTAAQSMELRGNLSDVLADDPRVRFVLIGKTTEVEEELADDLFGKDVPMLRMDFQVNVQDTAFALAQIHLPHIDFKPAQLRAFNGTRQPILHIADILERPLLRAEQRLYASQADALAAEKLHLPLHSPMMRMSRTYYDAFDEPLAYVIGHLHPHHIQVNVRLGLGTAESTRYSVRRVAKRSTPASAGRS